jgi:A/G-specific adenine glycosylase
MAQATFSSSALFAWYDRHARDLPWRHRWPDLAPAYHVWLSEIMLQQTVVATVIPYFLDFTRRWPRIENLAAAPLDDVLAAWAGLGYYARARNLHKAARQITDYHCGQFPQTYDGLLALPGVGPYTAGAISAIAFGQNQVVVDANIERVLMRYFGIKTPLPAAKSQIGSHYAAIMPDQRPSDFPQALMDFANAACTVKNPICTASPHACPFASGCLAGQAGEAESYPVKAPKKPKPERRGVAFVARLPSGEAFLIRRDDKGLLGGMLAFPSHGWASIDQAYDPSTPFANAPFAADWQLLDTPVQHIFTHFALEMDVAVARIVAPIDTGLASQKWQNVRTADLPTLMRKVWKLAKDAR